MESLDALNHIASLTGDLPLLIVGNYRDDEAPDIPEKIRSANSIKLERLSEEGIRELSISMLGDTGYQPELLDFLKRETEGNVFFLVEVVRALADDAGRLSDVGKRTLPHQIFAGGVKQVVQRRLARVSEEAKKVLEYVAVNGRYLDKKLITTLFPDIEMDEWLLTVSSGAIFEPVEEDWRFSHDKLREGLLQSIEEDDLASMHARIADTLQEIYMDNIKQYAMQIADHYQRASMFPKALDWHTRAGHIAFEDHAPELAIHHFRLALRLMDRYGVELSETSESNYGALLESYSKALLWQGNHNEAKRRLDELIAYTDKHNDLKRRAATLQALSHLAVNQGQLDKAMETVSEAEKLTKEAGEMQILVACLMVKGWTAIRMGNIALAREVGEELIQMAEQQNMQEALGQGHNLLSAVYYMLGRFNDAIRSATKAYEIQMSLGLRIEPMSTINNVGYLLATQGKHEEAVEKYNQALEIANNYGQRTAVLTFRANRAASYNALKRYEEALIELEDILPAAQTAGIPEVAEIQQHLATALLGLGRPHDALEPAREALRSGHKHNNPEYLAAAWRILGEVVAHYDETVRVMLTEDDEQEVTADECFAKSYEIADSSQVINEKARVLASHALYLRESDASTAQEKWQASRAIYQQLEAIAILDRMPEQLADYQPDA